MPIVKSNDYKPPIFLRNGHINTIYPYYFRKRPKVNFQRVRIHTPDNDFVDVDWIKGGYRRLTILLHGLEGSSSSQYILGTSKALIAQKWDIAAINFRSCSGPMNDTITMYHSGFTDDLHLLICTEEMNYDEIFIVGFSLGGNVVMKYISDQKYTLSPKIKSACGISVPCDLAAGSEKIKETQNHFYEENFIKTLSEKVKIKCAKYPTILDISHLKNIKNLIDIDDHYTGPMHGFKDAADYYAKCNCLQYLQNINIPTLMINALDDSFLPKQSYPFDQAKNSDYLFLMTPDYGGHVGFTTFGTEYYWVEQKIIEFFGRYSDIK